MVLVQTLLQLLGSAVGTLFRFLRDGLRVLLNHWPQLLGLFLIGWIGRMSFLWITTIVSDWSPTVAILVLPFAPLCTLLSFVLMMRAMAPSLPAFAGMITSDSRRKRWSEDFTVAGQVMIPFLAVYASAGLLREDAAVFLIDSAADERMNTVIFDIDFGRADYASGLAIVGFVVIALLIRKIISMRELVKKHLIWAGVAAYVEVLWIMTLARAMSNEFDKIASWVTSRRIIAAIIDWWEALSANIRAWSAPLGSLIDAVSKVLSDLGSVVIVPVAWLAIGATIYGYQLQASKLAVPGHEEVSRRIERVPSPVRRAALHVSEPVVTPVKSAWTAVRKVAVAGVLPMVMFCVVFLIAGGVQAAVAALLHTVIGPGDEYRQFALEPYATMVERGAYFILVLALLAAAVNGIVAAQREREEADAAEAEAVATQAEQSDATDEPAGSEKEQPDAETTPSSS